MYCTVTANCPLPYVDRCNSSTFGLFRRTFFLDFVSIKSFLTATWRVWSECIESPPKTRHLLRIADLNLLDSGMTRLKEHYCPGLEPELHSSVAQGHATKRSQPLLPWLNSVCKATSVCTAIARDAPLGSSFIQHGQALPSAQLTLAEGRYQWRAGLEAHHCATHARRLRCRPRMCANRTPTTSDSLSFISI
jgi:hypothetical protein